MDTKIVIPRRSRGRQSNSANAVYWRKCDEFAQRILQIASTLDFRPSSRGWCYVLEGWGVTKDDFDKAADVINDCRKYGSLPMDITSEDGKRAFYKVEQVDHVVRRARRRSAPGSPDKASCK
jgi:hypothetical protein